MSEADTCMYFCWNTLVFLTVWISRIDDCICFGRQDKVKKIKEETKIMFDCYDVGQLKYYVD